MNDTRVLLNRVAEFRQRLQVMPRLVPTEEPKPDQSTPAITSTANPIQVIARSRTQAIVQDSLRVLAGTAEPDPPPLANAARRLLADAHGLVTRLKAFADDPFLAGAASMDDSDKADPLSVHFRETAALTVAAVRYALKFPVEVEEQARLCEGLEAMIDAARRRFDLLAGAVERRRCDEVRIDRLARFLVALDHGEGAVDPDPLLDLANSILAEEPGRPLRFASADPLATQAYLGGTEFPAPARFVAAHALNCASVLARVIRADVEWRPRAQEVVVAALLHDVGMLRVDPAILAHGGSLDRKQRKGIEVHAATGAARIRNRLPELNSIAEVAATHHERADGNGYPEGRTGDQISPLAQLVSAADIYAAMCAARPHRAALDPRAALTDVLQLAERGRLDRYAAEKLLTLGLYPVGTVVELADGSTAVVLAPRDPRTAIHAAARPLVGLLADPNGRALATPRFVDLAEAPAGRVVRTIEPSERLRLLARSYPEWA